MFSDLVRNARSVRRYAQSDPVPESVLRELVDLARLTPSGGNQQPLRYATVAGAACDKVFPQLAWAAALKDWDGPAEGERPTGYIVVLSAADKDAPQCDIGIAAQTIQLAAAERGLGACMLGSIRRPAIHAALDLSEAWAVRLVIALGKPAEQVVLEEAAPGGDLKYYRTPDGVHHVPKRPLGEVLVGQCP